MNPSILMIVLRLACVGQAAKILRDLDLEDAASYVISPDSSRDREARRSP